MRLEMRGLVGGEEGGLPLGLEPGVLESGLVE